MPYMFYLPSSEDRRTYGLLKNKFNVQKKAYIYLTKLLQYQTVILCIQGDSKTWYLSENL